MRFFLVSEFLLLVNLIIFYFKWKKEKNRLNSYYIWLFFIGMVEILCQEILVVNVPQLSEEAMGIKYYPNLIFWIVMCVLLLFLATKSLRKKQSGMKNDSVEITAEAKKKKLFQHRVYSSLFIVTTMTASFFLFVLQSLPIWLRIAIFLVLITLSMLELRRIKVIEGNHSERKNKDKEI